MVITTWIFKGWQILELIIIRKRDFMFKTAQEALKAAENGYFDNYQFDPKTKFLKNKTKNIYVCQIDPYNLKRNFKQQSFFTNFEAEIHFYEETKLLTEKQYSEYYKCNVVGHYQQPSATIDLIGLRYVNQKLQVLLVKRLHRPNKGHWAMPGGFLDYEETINHACLREVKEETNVNLNDNQIIRMPAVSAKDRDPRMWVITNPNIVLFTPADLKHNNVHAGDDAQDTGWFDLKLVPDEKYNLHGNIFTYSEEDLKHFKLKIDSAMPLAFDHYQIIQSALRYLLKDFGWERMPLITKLLGHYVTTRELAQLYSNLNPKFANYDLSNLTRRFNDYMTKTKQYKKPGKNSLGRSLVIYKI